MSTAIGWTVMNLATKNTSFLSQSTTLPNCSFFHLSISSKDKHFLTSPKYSGLKLSLARRAFKKLVKKDDVIAEVYN